MPRGKRAETRPEAREPKGSKESAPVAVEEREPEKPEVEIPAASNPLPEREGLKTGDRLGFKVTDGKLDFGSVRSSSAPRVREALANTFRDPDARKWLGLEAMSPEEVEELFSPEQAGQVLDLIVKVEVIFASSTTKLPSEECDTYLSWSAREHEILDKQAARIVVRYVPADWLKRMDLWIFLLTFIGFTGMKFQKLNAHAREVAAASKHIVDDADKHPAAAREPEPPVASDNGASAPTVVQEGML